MKKILYSKFYILNFRNAFTIVELLVAIGLFSVFMTVAVGSFTNALRTQRQARALIAANSNVSLAIEQMAREVRTGYDFCIRKTDPTHILFGGYADGCTYNDRETVIDANVDAGGSPLVFINAPGDDVAYQLSNNAIERAESSGTFQAITGSNVIVRDLKFVIRGANDVSSYSAFAPEYRWAQRVTISVTVVPKDPTLSGFSTTLQTTISPRFPG